MFGRAMATVGYRRVIFEGFGRQGFHGLVLAEPWNLESLKKVNKYVNRDSPYPVFVSYALIPISLILVDACEYFPMLFNTSPLDPV